MNSSAKKSPKTRPSPLSIRLNSEERAALKARAGNMPLSTWAKSILLDAPVRRASPNVSIDRVILARLLAFLGSRRMADHLAVLANEADCGNLLLNEINAALLTQACEDITRMRVLLLASMGRRVSLSERLLAGGQAAPSEP